MPFWRARISLACALHGVDPLALCTALMQRACDLRTPHVLPACQHSQTHGGAHARAARTAWGAVYTYCRTFLARMEAYAGDAELPMRQLLMRWTIALRYLMRSRLDS